MALKLTAREIGAMIPKQHYIGTVDVTNVETYAQYVQQTTGTPWPSIADMSVLRKKTDEFFMAYPHCDWVTLCHVADWAKRRRRRYASVWRVLAAFPYAWEDGAIPELYRITDQTTEAGITEALTIETDYVWRRVLSCTEDGNKRKELLDQWLTTRKPTLVGAL